MERSVEADGHGWRPGGGGMSKIRKSSQIGDTGYIRVVSKIAKVTFVCCGSGRPAA
jgi:hypothetical protein